MTLIKTENDILQLIQSDQWMMQVLRTVRDLHLSDWWIAAGFVRNAVWDAQHGYTERTPLEDIDVVYFDTQNTDEAQEKQIEQNLRATMHLPWSVKNQARMHIRNGDGPYHSSAEAIGKWIETPTCVGVRLENDDSLTLCAPIGIDDLLQGIVRPNPLCRRNPEAYIQRIQQKQWHTQWPLLNIQ
jgi:uncharacterized protein